MFTDKDLKPLSVLVFLENGAGVRRVLCIFLKRGCHRKTPYRTLFQFGLIPVDMKKMSTFYQGLPCRFRLCQDSYTVGYHPFTLSLLFFKLLFFSLTGGGG